MPVPRHAAIILCSCGAKWGNAARAALHEDMMAVERVLLEIKVPVMVRHWRLSHRLTVQHRGFEDVIATVAARMAAGEAGEGDGEPVGLLGAGETE